MRLPVIHCRIPFCRGKSFINFRDRYGESFGEPTHFLMQTYWGRFYETAQILSAHGVAASVSPAVVTRAFDGATFALVVLTLLLLAMSAVTAAMTGGFKW